jgi:hypothetical protein
VKSLSNVSYRKKWGFDNEKSGRARSDADNSCILCLSVLKQLRSHLGAPIIGPLSSFVNKKLPLSQIIPGCLSMR